MRNAELTRILYAEIPHHKVTKCGISRGQSQRLHNSKSVKQIQNHHDVGTLFSRTIHLTLFYTGHAASTVISISKHINGFTSL